MRPLELVVKEIAAISRDFSKGMLEFVVPPKPVTNKPKWCCCQQCGKWHPLGE